MNLEKAQYRCSKCKEVNGFLMYKEIDVTDHPEFREKVLSGNIFQFTCESCGQSNYLEYPLIYRDSKRKFLIWLLPGDSSSDPLTEFLKEANESIRDWNIRIVDNANRLIEKILIFENGLDDHTLEFQKSMMARKVLDANPDMKLEGMFYQPDSSLELGKFSIQNEYGFGQAVEVYKDLYDQLFTAISNSCTKELKQAYRVDQTWVLNYINSQETSQN